MSGSHDKLRVFQSLLTPKTYQKSQEYLGDLLNMAYKSGNQFVGRLGQPGTLTGPSPLSPTPEGLGAPTGPTQIQAPKFKDKDEAKAWFQGLSPEDQQRYIAQRGGQ